MTKRTLFLIFAFLLPMSILASANAPLWLRYPAISPDGQTIVFNYKGDIYKVSAKGGEAVPLTFHKAYDYNAIWSPDGKTIAFASNRNGNNDIFVIPAQGGMAKRVTTNSANEIPGSFTPDGKSIIFSAQILDNKDNVMFPSGAMTELYEVSVNGGRYKQILSTPALKAKYNADKSKLIYQDIKGYEDKWRKHHTSSVTRDIWIYDEATKKHKKVSMYNGEDRDPVFGAGNDFYYLSEKFGTFNIVKSSLSNPNSIEPVTNHTIHPVRFLSKSDNNTFCYSFNGEIYTIKEEQQPVKLNIAINVEDKENNVEFLRRQGGPREMAVSPDGKEVAFIVRGDVFVTSVEYRTTKQITNTPTQERSVSYHPKGRTLLYAAERNGSWDLYKTSIVRDEEKSFSTATLLKEEPVLVSDQETFQPAYSPDGKKIAYLENRVVIKVMDVKSKKSKTLLEEKYNYSYSDGDQYYEWSPDGKWLLATYDDKQSWPLTDIALINVETGKIHNLTESGYGDSGPKWMMKGQMIIWQTDKHGYRSHGSWGSHGDIYGMFLTQEAYDVFKMSKEEYAAYKEAKKSKKPTPKKDDKKDKKKKKSKKDDKKKDKNTLKPIKIEFKDLDERVARLTMHSSSLSDAVVTPDGQKLYYLSRFEKGFDLWLHDFKKRSTRLVTKLSGYSGGMQLDKSGKNVFLFSGGGMIKINLASKKQKRISFSAEMQLDKAAEREYMFSHMWRQVREKFYDPNLHGVDWELMKKDYSRFLPHINNYYDFAEMSSELLGELNASHTGCSYRSYSRGGDATATFCVFYDDTYTGKGLKIAEIMEKSPLFKVKSKVVPGVIIEKIDGIEITPEMDYYPLLNRKAGKRVLVSFYNPQTKKRWDEVVKPKSKWYENAILYERWVENRKKEVERLSNGRLGYVHVRGMNSSSFREVYAEAKGRYNNAEALIVDTRFNGGGWLHDDLATFLSGEKYAELAPRGRKVGVEPINKWYKPSVVLISESNYSDAHGFPFAYRALKIGKTIGMPVPGTMTAVWWESLQNSSIVFGIPQVGFRDLQGRYQENFQFEPDIKVNLDKDIVIKNRDQQIEKAVEHLLSELDKK